MTETEFNAQHVACDDCDWTGTGADITTTLHMIHHLADRLDPGAEVPAGECPECGALAYVTKAEPAAPAAEKPGPPTKVTVPLHWYVLINPDWYDDESDRGYAWSGEADDEAGALAKACAECDADNDRDEPTDPTKVSVWDCHPDRAKNILAVAKAYDDLLNAHELVATADDYTELYALIAHAAAAQVATVVTLHTKGR